MGWDDRSSRSSRSYSNGRDDRYGSGRDSRTIDIDPLGIHIDMGTLADVGNDLRGSFMRSDTVRSTVEPVYGFVKTSISTARRIAAGIQFFLAFAFFCVTFEKSGYEGIPFCVTGIVLGAIFTRVGLFIAGVNRGSAQYAGRSVLRIQLAVLCALILAGLVVALLSHIAVFPPVQSIAYAVIAIALIICICRLVNVRGIIANVTHQRRKTEHYQALAQAIPAAIDSVFDGWRPRELDLKRGRATAPSTDGLWKQLGRQSATFKMSEKDIASYVCADILLMARTYAEQDIEEGSETAGRFLYRETFNVVPAPQETRLMSELVQRLTQCGTVVYYEGLGVDVREGQGHTASCSISAKITIAI